MGKIPAFKKAMQEIGPPEDWRIPKLSARTQDRKFTCDCLNFIGDDELREMLLGHVLTCYGCGSPMWFEPQTVVEDPEHFKVYYAFERKWKTISLFTVGFWVRQIIERSDEYANFQPDTEPYNRTRPRVGETGPTPKTGAILSTVLRNRNARS